MEAKATDAEQGSTKQSPGKNHHAATMLTARSVLLLALLLPFSLDCAVGKAPHPAGDIPMGGTGKEPQRGGGRCCWWEEQAPGRGRAVGLGVQGQWRWLLGLGGLRKAGCRAGGVVSHDLGRFLHRGDLRGLGICCRSLEETPAAVLQVWAG